MFIFNNIGKKIKILAEMAFIIEALASIISGIVLICMGIMNEIASLGILGIVLFILGPVLSYIGVFVLYGFGELIDSVCSINQKLPDSQIQCNDFQPLKNEETFYK